jgi:hypothetical protein
LAIAFHAGTGQTSRVPIHRGQDWYAVRCVVRFPDREGGSKDVFEERITLWRADSFADAIARADFFDTGAEHQGDVP